MAAATIRPTAAKLQRLLIILYPLGCTRADVINALFEGIMAAFNATAFEGNDDFNNCRTYAHAALASLEASGVKVVRKS